MLPRRDFLRRAAAIAAAGACLDLDALASGLLVPRRRIFQLGSSLDRCRAYLDMETPDGPRRWYADHWSPGGNDPRSSQLVSLTFESTPYTGYLTGVTVEHPVLGRLASDWSPMPIVAGQSVGWNAALYRCARQAVERRTIVVEEAVGMSAAVFGVRYPERHQRLLVAETTWRR